LMEMHVAMSRDILDALDRGALDAAIVLRHDNRLRDGELILEESFGWMAAPDSVPGSPCSLPRKPNPAPSEAWLSPPLPRREYRGSRSLWEVASSR
jgi:DNA-binding transcriptional LysR family regulator